MQYARGKVTYECDWDNDCTKAFASRDDLDRHEREDHWSKTGESANTKGA